MKFLAVLLLGFATSWNMAQDKWATADSITLRLPPKAFSELPKGIAKYLERRGCTVPQTFLSSEPHNVISGEFARRGQTDWAVLCSRAGESSILVFWHASTKSVSEIAKASDRGFLQILSGDGKVVFSRAIAAVGRNYILRHDRAFGAHKPPRMIHQGINDVYVEKASVVLYYHRGKWLELQGAD